MTRTRKGRRPRLSAKFRHLWFKTKRFLKKKETISFCIKLLRDFIPPIVGWIIGGYS